VTQKKVNTSVANDDAANPASDDFWAFNPQQAPAVNLADDTSLDELLALYQTAHEVPPNLKPVGSPESYDFDFSATAPQPSTELDFSTTDTTSSQAESELFDFSELFDEKPAEAIVNTIETSSVAPVVELATTPVANEEFSFESFDFDLAETEQDSPIASQTIDVAEEKPDFDLFDFDNDTSTVENKQPIVLDESDDLETFDFDTLVAVEESSPVLVAPVIKDTQPEVIVSASAFVAKAEPQVPQDLNAINLSSIEHRNQTKANLSNVLEVLNAKLEHFQQKTADLYAALQDAALRRAPVSEIQSLTLELANLREEIQASQPLKDQALMIKNIGEAYLGYINNL
jgi:hypothetical protein